MAVAANQPVEPLRWLCIAYAFPPLNRSGTHRTLGFVRELDAMGWMATVVTVRPDGEEMDGELNRLIPDGTEVLRTRWVNVVPATKGLLGKLISSRKQEHSGSEVAIRRRMSGSEELTSATSSVNKTLFELEARDDRPRDMRVGFREWLSRLCMTPDSRNGWIPYAVAAGLGAVRRRRPHVLYSTSPYASAHLAAMILHWWTRIPWVADFRDPWRDNPFLDRASRSLDRLDEWLERLVLRSASHVIFNTSTAAEAACRRMDGLRPKCSVIPNGYDADVLRATKPIRLGERDDFFFVHAGEFYNRRRPQFLFEALGLLGRSQPELASRIRLILIGPDRFEGTPLRSIAQHYGIASCVTVYGPKPHRETLSLIAGCDAGLVIGADGPGSDLQIPNKLFEYLGLGKPVLMTVGAANPALELLRKNGVIAETCLPDDPVGMARALGELVRRLGASHSSPESRVVSSLDRRHRAAELVNVFQSLLHRKALGRSFPKPESHPSSRLQLSDAVQFV